MVFLHYLEDRRLELTNNRAERNIKPFVIGRKSFLFANTPLGTQANAVIYSLIETAKETGVYPFRHLTWLLKTAPTLDQAVDGWVGPLLPANAPEDCRMSCPNFFRNAIGTAAFYLTLTKETAERFGKTPSFPATLEP